LAWQTTRQEADRRVSTGNTLQIHPFSGLSAGKSTATIIEYRIEKFDPPVSLIYWEDQGMKGNEKVIEKLNALLADELTAISQYMVHSEMCANWGYKELHEAVEKRAIDEMKHAEKLIGRLLFLEGRPVVSDLNKITIGADVSSQIQNDWSAEEGAIKAYNDGIRLTVELGDNGTRAMLESILADEEDHIDWLEAQLDQIKQMGLQIYLVEQVD
jgi:bacterioferritin